METYTTVADLRPVLQAWRAAGQRYALVPTMGNLHVGHLTLVKHAQALAERVVVSIFVNPLQFGANEDLASYPRTLAADQAQLATLGTDVIFAPSADALYPQGLAQTTKVEVPELGQILCGISRPIHFRGVATVVNMLFNIVQPDVAVFGEKDYQQLRIIRRMVTDLWLPIQIIGVPTVRETDGLAMSSRNAYLTAAERQIAPRLAAILQQLKQQLMQGRRDFANLAAEGITALDAQGFRTAYLSIRHPETLALLSGHEQRVVILAAAYLGKTRLIDNLVCDLNAT